MVGGKNTAFPKSCINPNMHFNERNYHFCSAYQTHKNTSVLLVTDCFQSFFWWLSRKQEKTEEELAGCCVGNIKVMQKQINKDYYFIIVFYKPLLILTVALTFLVLSL